MPLIPSDVNCSTSPICCAASFSVTGPFQRIVTPVSSAAFCAPACTLCQNTCVVPLGMTARRIALCEPELEPADADDEDACVAGPCACSCLRSHAPSHATNTNTASQ